VWLAARWEGKSCFEDGLLLRRLRVWACRPATGNGAVPLSEVSTCGVLFSEVSMSVRAMLAGSVRPWLSVRRSWRRVSNRGPRTWIVSRW
jgi:hypothetical protein